MLPFAGLLLCGCFDNVETMFPPGLEPWENPNEAPLPEAVEGDPYPETIVFVQKRWTGGAYADHARSYVKADVRTTFDAVRNPLAGADRRPTVTFTWVDMVDPDYLYSFRSHLTVPDILTVEFELTWHSGIVEGTVDAPTITATLWQKTWGSTAITLLEGSIVCRRVTDDVTELDWQYHLNAFGSDWTTIENYLQGFQDSVVALAHGLPLPEQM
jgi:hypothetical protein